MIHSVGIVIVNIHRRLMTKLHYKFNVSKLTLLNTLRLKCIYVPLLNNTEATMQRQNSLKLLEEVIIVSMGAVECEEDWIDARLLNRLLIKQMRACAHTLHNRRQ